MYSNDVRVANTAAPSFQAKANVTQYGWTDVDQGHYNQLIQYVDECRKIWKDLSEKIEYIEGLLVEVAGIDEQVKFVNQKADEVAEDARQTKTDVIMSRALLNQMILLNTDFQTKYTDFVDKYPDFLIKYEETVLNAAHAAVSATEAEGWFNKTYDLYLDLKNGQVYRGTWNPATGAYPAHGGTNSVWDVVLDAGVDSVDYGTFTWHNGDRLLYILADNKYDQLRTGSGVLSVNGKTGAVTLTPADVGALGATEPSVSTARFTTPVKIAGKEFDGTGDLEIYPNDIDAASKYITVNGQGLDKNVILTARDVGAIDLTEAETGNGLVMRVGGDRDLAIQAALADATGGAYMAETPPRNPIPGARWFDTNDGRTYLYYVDGDSSQWIEENPQSPDIIQTSPLLQELANDYRLDPLVQIRGDFGIFHEGAPPTPEQVGALNKSTGGAITGSVSIAGPQGQSCLDLLQTPVPAGANALGIAGFDSNGVNRTFGTGLFYENAAIQYAYLGSGSAPWTQLKVFPDNSARIGDNLVHTNANNAFVLFSQVFTANAANTWVINDSEMVCRLFPGGLHFQGIFRRTPGASIGDGNIGWFTHKSCTWPYTVCLSNVASPAAATDLQSVYIERGSGGNTIQCNNLQPAAGWIMLSMLVQYH